jgi:hypothetical protein
LRIKIPLSPPFTKGENEGGPTPLLPLLKGGDARGGSKKEKVEEMGYKRGGWRKI